MVIVTWNGREHLGPCLSSLAASDYPADRLEVVVVDNGSSDGTVDWIAREHPRVRVVPLASNQGFTGGNTAGVAAATGDVLVFFNNDMRVEPDTVRRLVAAAADGTACAAARVLSWDGRAIDFLRGTISFEARGFQDYYGEPVTLDRTRATDTFFPNGGAFAVTRAAYDRAGGFDDAFFAYYDDVDLGWRLRLVGLDVRVEDDRHRLPPPRRDQPHPAGRTEALPHGAQRAVDGDQELRRGHAAADARPGAAAGGAAPARRGADRRARRRARPLRAVFPPRQRGRALRRDLSSRPAARRRSPPAGERLILGLPAESLAAIGAVIDTLGDTAQARRRIQAARRAGERDVLPHFGRAFECISSFASYRPIQEALIEALDLQRVFTPRPRLLIVSHEAIATNMSGPAVRFLEIGRALSSVARVTLAMPGEPGVRDAQVTIAGFDPAHPGSLRRLAEDADVIFVQGFALALYPFLTALMVPIVVDLYCPFTIEHLEQTRGRAAAGDAAVNDEAAGFLGVLNAQIDQGDFFICASEVQRDFWIGALHSRGRINPRTYAADPTLRRLIDVVPFGLPDDDFDRTAAALPPVLKGVRPGIAATDTVLLWGGSLLDWQDPVTLIEAVAALAPRRPELKLVFMGTKHPNPLVKPMRAVAASRERAEALGVLDRHVFFNDWVPYTERARYLAEADLGVSTHREHLETHFAFRTRMLDYVWARLPIVCTDGDVFARLVRSEGLGAAVPPGDAAALAQAIDRLLGRRRRARLGPRRARPARPRAALEPRGGAARALPRGAGERRGSRRRPGSRPRRSAGRLPRVEMAEAHRAPHGRDRTARRAAQAARPGPGPRGGAQPRRARPRDAPRALSVLTHATAELHRTRAPHRVSRQRTWAMHVLATCGTGPAHTPRPPSEIIVVALVCSLPIGRAGTRGCGCPDAAAEVHTVCRAFRLTGQQCAAWRRSAGHRLLRAPPRRPSGTRAAGPGIQVRKW